jgi:hypothetical protein
MPRHTKHYGDCPYCGEYDRLTKEHVIPQGLFPENEPLPGDIPKIYVCASCNNKKKSGFDTDLRDMLIFDMDSSQSPNTQLLHPRLERAIGRNQSRIVRAMKEHSYPVQISNEPDTPIQGYTSPESNKQMPKILEMIVRGLFFHHTRRILPPEIVFSGTRERNTNRYQEIIQALPVGTAPLNKIGNGEVFEYRFDVANNDPDNSVWMLIFYKRAIFIMLTQSSEKMVDKESDA